MGNITVNIKLTSVGSGLGSFNIYTDVDNYVTPIAQGVSTAVLVNGYSCTVVPDTATTIKVQSTVGKNVYKLFPIAGLETTQLPTPTPTPTNTPQPTPAITPTPTPSITPSGNIYTVSFTPVVVDNLAYRKSVKSYVTVTPSLPSGHSFNLHYENYAIATTTGGIEYAILSKAERRDDVAKGYWDRASAFIDVSTVDKPYNDDETNVGSILIDSSSISTTYFYVEVVGDPSISPQSIYHLNSKCRITNISDVTGGGTFVIDNTDYLIQVTAPDL